MGLLVGKGRRITYGNSMHGNATLEFGFKGLRLTCNCSSKGSDNRLLTPRNSVIYSEVLLFGNSASG